MSVERAVEADYNDDREGPMTPIRRLFAKAMVATAGCALAAAFAAPAVEADFGIKEFAMRTSSGDEFSRQAGAHPDLTTKLRFPAQDVPSGVAADGEVSTIKVGLPPGVVGNPTAAPTCTSAEIVEGYAGKGAVCPIGSQVGVAYISESTGSDVRGQLVQPVYNMVPPNDLPALFAFNVEGVVIKIEPKLRGADYGVATTTPSISQAIKVLGTEVILWGVPADPSHDSDRWLGDSQFYSNRGHASPSARLPFMTNPTSCPGLPAQFTAEADTWQGLGIFSHASLSSDPSGTPYTFDGCERLHFDPSIRVSPGTHRAASPTGLDISIEVPQSRDPYGLASAHVRKVVTTFPLGMTVSPSAVAGLGACSLAEIGLGSTAAPTCPDSSKIGNATIKSPLLTDPLEGEVALARQNENPFNSLFAIYLIVKGPGFYIKLPGELNVDKQTGQLRTVFENTPQLPFEELALDFRGGPTAPLRTPDVCGIYQTHTEITSWADPDPVIIEAPMLIDEDCIGKGAFNPTLQAGVANPVAGAKSPLTIRIRRQDGEQNISRFNVTLPQGELASLKGVGVCPEALAPSGNCPKDSQVGISTTAIGTGAFPLFVPQPGKDPTALYLAGPYKGSPYSLVAKVPAQSGPFDFGLIVVRTAINLNPVTAQVIAETDPLPQILEGVPIQYRDVRIEVQKPDFTVNPTSCEQRFVKTTITSVNGAVAHPSVPAKVGDCASLGFGPKLAFRLKGGTNRGDFQALTATLTSGRHEANIAKAAITLPHSEFLEQSHIGTVCTRVQFAAKRCPEASIYGSARAITPLLDQPLEGPVYLRSSNHALPDLVAALSGQFDIELAGRIDSVNGGIRNSFEVVPDAPVTKFTLKMKGGQKSLLVNSRNLCKAPSRADVRMVGQNGKRHSERPVVHNSCAKKKKAQSAKQRRR